MAVPGPEERTQKSVNRRVLALSLFLVLPLLLVLVLNIGRDPHTVASPLVGRPAPPFSLPPVGGGSPIALADLLGKPVVLNFWATWCVPCFEEHGVLMSGARTNSAVQFLGVVYEDEEEQVKGFLDRQGSRYPSLMDESGKTAIAYGVFGVPETFFIDARGTIVGKFVGPLTDAALGENLSKAAGATPAPGPGSPTRAQPGGGR